MTSLKQVEANRRNASKSTGPITEAGKHASRANAVRHGLTAETVIGALEDAADYRAFEAAITADYDAQSAVERELVLRLASLLWRLRRATAIEIGLFTAGLDQLGQDGHRHCIGSEMHKVPTAARPMEINFGVRPEDTKSEELRGQVRAQIWGASAPNPSSVLARCFLHLTELPNFTLDRLNRYEAGLWRHVAQTLFALDALDRRKPQERRRQG